MFWLFLFVMIRQAFGKCLAAKPYKFVERDAIPLTGFSIRQQKGNNLFRSTAARRNEINGDGLGLRQDD